MDKKQAANVAIDIHGPVELARRLATSRDRVQKWRHRGVPPIWVLGVEKETGISRHLLAPKLYPLKAA